ncbi:MAG: NifB/NifX family molybdenum-iron cluster-binding protein [Pseudodesulfovibrio sp.]
MGRRKKRRLVEGLPDAVFFKPQGIPMKELQRQAISIEGFEALRLVDGEGMLQQEAADRMGVSRPTLSRILAEARKGVATALANGWAIEIEGGAYHCLDGICPKCQPSDQGEAIMPNMDGTGPLGGGRGGGRGMGRGTGMGRRQGGQGCAVGAGRAQGGQGRGMGPCGQAGANSADAGQGGMGNRQRSRSIQQSDPSTATGGAVKKIAITSEGPSLDDRVDPRFGRAAGFVIVDLETMKTSYMDNGSSQVRAQGAGIQAAENVAGAGVQVVLTGNMGPKAFDALSAAGVQVVQNVDGMSVGEAIAKFKNGDVAVAETPNTAGGANK